HKPDTMIEALGSTVAEELLKPHRSYLGPLEGLLGAGIIKGLAHITGGGLLENIPRILPKGASAEIRAGSWPVLPVFNLIASMGKALEREMYRTFNMGIGMVVIVSPGDAPRLSRHLDERGEKHYDIGQVIDGTQVVEIIKQ